MSLFEAAMRMEIEERQQALAARRAQEGEKFACTLAESALLQEYDEKQEGGDA